MGCCMSTEDKERIRRNDEIENQLRRDRMNMRNEVKMLLLGAGESGKSTILKQLKLINEGSYSQDERLSFREIIFVNTYQSMRVVLTAMKDLGITLANPSNEAHVSTLLAAEQTQFEGDAMPAAIAVAIRELWGDAGVRECQKRSREYQLNDSARYYFDSIERISQPNYIPTDQDVLRSRVKTTGITEATFHVGDITYRVFDVGGQRSERKKWIHCFENVTAIIFLVAISEYDQNLREDESVNRMQEALTLFDSICNSRWFVNTSIILFLNKIDLFREKLLTSPLNAHFPDYTGGQDYDSACEYFLNRFVALNRSESKQIYTHFTCATDTQQIRIIMSSVNDILVQSSLREVGLL
ncbi:uncharacterized protein VTP21DRAFT_1954 [Calcarisporiella thermophila]|uniref:uncharacterized protein n=1 Tax=Calcarisporiella thermophila TaxID=911321 RepID=UPI00374206CE